MEPTSCTTELSSLLSDGAEVNTTVYDFGKATIRRFVKGKLCLLQVSGIYSSSLGKEIEKLALQWRGDLGLAFKDIAVNPRTRRKFDPSSVATLGNVLKKTESRKKTLTLLSPPSELTDTLKLAGTLEYFHVLGEQSSFKPTPSAQSKEKSKDRTRPKESVTLQQKKIQILNQSLNRTEKLEKGLDSAAKYVKRFLSREPPKIPGYEFSFLYKTSEKVGGDFFDFIPLTDDRLGICIGDVSGHGMDAAILMGISKKVIRIRATDDTTNSPRQVLCKASKDISEDFSRSSFVTSLYGILDLRTGDFTFARAGHEHPLLLGPAPGMQHTVQSGGSPLGLDSVCDLEAVLDEKRLTVPPGGFLLLVTDGLPEARSEKGVEYTRDRLRFDLVKVSQDTPCNQALGMLCDSLESFTGGAAQEDDITAILIKRNV